MRNFTILHVGVMHMINQRRILALLLSLFLTVGAGPAWAVSLIDTFIASRTGPAGESGTDIVEMTDNETTFCVLSDVAVEDDTGNDDERTQCRVAPGVSGRWVLVAILSPGNDASVGCEATCFTND
jgi:hypothetical protein